MMLIPEPVGWPICEMDLDRRGFYSTVGDDGALGWSGRSLLHGRKLIGATLDRNGLRPCRYQVTTTMCRASPRRPEYCRTDQEDPSEGAGLQPGRMFLVDTIAGRIVDDEEIKADITKAKPYRAWVMQDTSISLDELPDPERAATGSSTIVSDNRRLAIRRRS